LRTAIAGAQSIVLVASPDSRQSTYVRDEIAIARMRNKQIYPVWAKGTEWIESIPMGMGYIQNIDMRVRAYNSGLQTLINVLTGQTSSLTNDEVIEEKREMVINPKNPFKGLQAFREDDAPLFFGRESLIDSLVSRLNHQLQNHQARFLAVLGPSGAGKSSVVMAGLVPALKNNTQSSAWIFLPPMVPGKHPIEHLADVLKSEMKDTPLHSIESDLNAPGSQMLHRLVRQLPADHVVLYVDQFEELFTLTANESERAQFINLLSYGATETDGKLIVLISMRADFLDRPLVYPLLGELLNSFTELVRPMSIAELRDSIVLPTQLPEVGLIFDDGLVEEIVYSLRSQNDRAMAGALPLLQFTLDRLFEERQDNHLTRDSYQAMGGVSGAIGTHSENVFKSLSLRAQKKLGDVFLQLISIDENTGEITRRRASQSDVLVDEASHELVMALVKNRLLQTGNDGSRAYVEITHEALFSNWAELKTWIDDVRDDLLVLRRLQTAVREWDNQKRPDYLLWRHEQLQRVYVMLDRLNINLNDAEIAFCQPEAARLLARFQELKTADMREALTRQVNIVYRFEEIGFEAIPYMVVAHSASAGPGSRRFLEKALESYGMEECLTYIEGHLQHREIYEADLKITAKMLVDALRLESNQTNRDMISGYPSAYALLESWLPPVPKSQPEPVTSSSQVEAVKAQPPKQLTKKKPVPKSRKSGGMQTFQINVIGPFRSGITTFIKSISEIDVISTDKAIGDKEATEPTDVTTVAMDFGRRTIDEDLALYLFGMPGQRRFDFMWEILAEKMLGLVVLVDSRRPETFMEAKIMLETLRAYSPVPFVVAANKQDQPDALDSEDIRIALALTEDISIIPCIATDEASVRNVLLELIKNIIEELQA